MQKKGFGSYIFSGGLLGSVGLMLLAVHLLWNPMLLLGGAGLFLCLAGMTIFGSGILYHVYRLDAARWSTWVLGFLFAWIFISSSIGVAFIVTTVTPFILWASLSISYILLSCLFFIVWSFPGRCTVYQSPYSTIPFGQYLCFSSHYLWLLLYGAAWLYGMIVLFTMTPSSDALLTPWQALPSVYLTAVLVSSFFLLALLFSRVKTGLVLLAVVLQSVLIHAYIPMSSLLPYGGDVWRHIGWLSHTVLGEPIRPILFGSDIAMIELFGMQIPAVFTHVQKFAYSFTWGSVFLLQQTLSISFAQIFIWLGPIIFSIGMPVIGFFLGYLFFGSPRKGLIFSSILLIPFSFQAVGSLTLPVTFGYLVFFGALLGLFFALKDGCIREWWFVWLSIPLLAVIYPLHALLFAYLAFSGVVLRYFITRKKIVWYRILLILCMVGGVLFLPLIEWQSGSLFLPQEIDFVQQTKELVKEFSGWYIAESIHLGDRLTGNIFMNYTPQSAFVSTSLSDWRWHVLIYQCLLYLLTLFGMIRAWIQRRDLLSHMMLIYMALTFGGYILGWYVFEGERQMIRRLDMALAFGALLFAWYGLLHLYGVLHRRVALGLQTIGLFLLGIGSIWVLGTTFVSGPDMRVVSQEEAAVAAYIAEEYADIKCVLANTWPLLVLESHMPLEGGGFPVGTQYAQAERVALYDRLLFDPTPELIADVGEVIPTFACIFVVPLEDTDVSLSTYEEVFGSMPTALIGMTAMWQVQLQNSDNLSTLSVE